MAEKKRVQKRDGAQGKARRTAENRSKTGGEQGPKVPGPAAARPAFRCAPVFGPRFAGAAAPRYPSAGG